MKSIYLIRVVKTKSSNFRVGEFLRIWRGDIGETVWSSGQIEDSYILVEPYGQELKEILSEIPNIEIELIKFESVEHNDN